MKLKVTDLKKHLKEYEQKELIQLISDLYKTSKEVQSYLSVRFQGEEAVTELFNQAKKKIEKGFGKLHLNEAKKAITDFKNLTGNELKTTDLMLFYVEQGVDFTNSYGDINESFYTSLESMYEKVLTLCNKEEEYYKVFASRLKQVVIETEGIGWGFHDQLYCLYSEFQEWNDEE